MGPVAMPSSASCHVLSNRKEKFNIHLQACPTAVPHRLLQITSHRPAIWDKQEFFPPPRCSFKFSVRFHLRPHSHRVTLPFLSNPNPTKRQQSPSTPCRDRQRPPTGPSSSSRSRKLWIQWKTRGPTIPTRPTTPSRTSFPYDQPSPIQSSKSNVSIKAGSRLTPVVYRPGPRRRAGSMTAIPLPLTSWWPSSPPRSSTARAAARRGSGRRRQR